MATFSTERKLPSKTVQELAISCEDVPKQYIYSEEAAAVIRPNVSSGEIPVIDLSLLSSPSPEGIEELMKFRSALSSWGCFQAINHGIESSILHNLHDVIKDFFKLPVAEKQRCSRNVNDMEGYGNETIFSEDQVLDWCDRLYLKIYPQDKRQLSVWPENPPAFREIVHKYSLHLKAILEIVLKAMARTLNLEENCFIDQYGERGFMQARFTYYPRCPRPDYTEYYGGNVPSVEIELPALPVQEIACKGEGVPEAYLQENAVSDASLPWMTSTTIDLHKLTSSLPQERDEELGKLRLELTSWGCIQVINHGMSSMFLDEMRELTREFFVLPLEEKNKYARPINDFEGYGNDAFKNRNLDWVDRLYLLAYPEDRRRLQFWPEEPKTFRPLLGEFAVKSQTVLELLLKAMALSLKLEENGFLEHYGETGSMFTRFNFYPPCPRPDLTLGIKEHTDGTVITIVVQDKQVEGLQVLKGDQWFKVPVIPDALFINIGDQMEMMSNGIFKSPVHRVVTNSEKERISIIMFTTPELENEIGPLDQLITKDRPQLYKKVKNYPEVYLHYYQLGEKALSVMKL